MTSKDNTIKLGDMVVVERGRPCCGKNDQMGRIFTVSLIFDVAIYRNAVAQCGECKQRVTGNFATYKKQPGTVKRHAFHLSQLTKINPPEKTQTTTKEKVLETT